MSVLNLLLSAGRAIGAWRRRSRAYAELMALDDHSLADIGIHRSEIPAIVAGSYCRDQAEAPHRSGWPERVPLPLLMPPA